MATESSDRIMQQADALLRRVSPAARDLARRQRQRRHQRMMQRLRTAAIWSAVLIVGWAGLGAVLSTFSLSWIVLSLIICAAIAFFILVSGKEDEPSAEKLMESELPALPEKTESWLAQQQRALPPPANRKLDAIATRLEELRPQLQNLDPREPAAIEVRRLVGVELPELVEGYKRVPSHLRKDDGRGRSPEKQLIDGLDVVEGEIRRMTQQLAAGELDALATQGKYLELKYRGDEELND